MVDDAKVDTADVQGGHYRTASLLTLGCFAAGEDFGLIKERICVKRDDKGPDVTQPGKRSVAYSQKQAAMGSAFQAYCAMRTVQAAVS